MNYRGGYTFEDNSVDDIPNPFENFNDPGYRKQQYSNAYGDYQGGYGPTRSNQSKIFQGPGPIRNQRAPSMWGRGFGPNGPPFSNSKGKNEDRAVKYLVRCGLPMNSVKSLPRELLELMEPHYCGLCGHNFEAFETSRAHYLSRKHAKNKQKWLSQRGGQPAPAQAFNEAPFRSRDQYCELCDVQITSKVHADSHYSGKSHRAIVEGRKGPKNVNLLKPGMQGRVTSLIRREKKFLQMNTPEAPVESAKKETKIIPDLYCEICKTSVTCTEQMTAHLNGKRHLSKEKQYILKAMQGGTAAQTESNDADAENQEGDGDAEQEGNYNAEAEGAQNSNNGGNEGGNADNDEWGDEWD